MAKGKELTVPASEAALAALAQEYPVEFGFKQVLLPRFGLVSQDITEEVKNAKGKKEIKIISEAGTFFTEMQSDEEEEVEDADGKTVKRKKWERTELGTEAEGIILFQRKQLKYYDQDTEEFTSSPVYDTDDEVVPLFLNKKEIERGTPAELKKLYPGVNQSGKAVSKLEDNRILYVLMDGEIYQLNLRGSSMYSFLTYARATRPNTVVTKFGSEAREKGSIAWNMMTFEALRPLTGAEAETAMEKVTEIKQGIAEQKAYFASQQSSDRAEGESDEDYQERKKRNKDF